MASEAERQENVQVYDKIFCQIKKEKKQGSASGSGVGKGNVKEVKEKKWIQSRLIIRKGVPRRKQLLLVGR